MKEVFFDKPSVAYILGVFLGDGYITSDNRGNYKIGLNTIDYPFAISFKQALERIGLKPFITGEKPSSKDGYKRHLRYKVVAYSLQFYNFCRKMKADLQNILDFIGEDGRLILLFIRGFYESEGFIRIRYRNSIEIGMVNTNIKIVRFLEGLFKKINIKVSVCKETNNRYKSGAKYTIRVLGKKRDKIEFMQRVSPIIKGYRRRTDREVMWDGE